MSCTKASKNVVSDSIMETDTSHIPLLNEVLENKNSKNGSQDVLREMVNEMQRLKEELNMLKVELKNKDVSNNEVL